MVLKLEILNNLLSGKFDHVPELNKKVVRIFISSTFTDTQNERDYLIENIFPKLKEYCRKNYDLDFQTVDMRWGVPSDSYEKHGVTELCLKEVANCQHESIGPNFVALLGHKYGKRLLSHKIEATEFEMIKNEILKLDLTLAVSYESPVDGATYKIGNIFSECFKLDENERPNFYHLLPISHIVKDFASENPLKKENANRFWNLVENKIADLFRLGAKSAYESAILNREAYERYFVSTTEKEIYNGILKVDNANKSALCFIRDIENLENCINDKKAERFIDIRYDKDGNKIVDREAQGLLEDLKKLKIPEKLHVNTNMFYYKVAWKDNAIDPDTLVPYLKSFGDTFYKEIIRLIDNAMQNDYVYNTLGYEAFVSNPHRERTIDKLRRVKSRLKMSIQQIKEVETQVIHRDVLIKEIGKELRKLVHEIASHSKQYKEITGKFFGRDDLMVKIEEYILNESRLPFIVTGESGSGKTNVMGMCAYKTLKWVKNPEDYTVILRFLGTSIATSSIYKTFASVALQLHFVITMLQEKRDPKNSYSRRNIANYEQYCNANDVNSFVSLMYEQFAQISKLDSAHRVVLILDSLDQLARTDYNNVSQWFFTQLPKNVKIICSVVPDDMFEAVKKRLLKVSCDSHVEETQILRIKTLSIELSETILSNWLSEKNKYLTNKQWENLRVMFAKAHLLPLYIQLIYDVVLHLRSYDTLDEKFLECRKIDDCIEYMFQRMEKLHGKVIFSHAVFYMTACKNGISESELEDMLSLDNEVLMSIFQYHIPPIRRVPFILWVRIRNELSDYIMEREANDTKVIYWYHRRFIEVAIQVYVEPMARENANVFENIIDFYNETWKSKEKPFQINDYLKNKLGLADSNTVADRHISSQPIEYYDDAGKVHFNKRKLAELPNCLANISSNIALEKACNLIFYNYLFMHAKFTCDSLIDVQHDLERIITSTTSWNVTPELTDYLNALRIMFKILQLCGDLCQDYPDALAYQISSRLLIVYGESKIITKFIDECDALSTRNCAFIAPYYQLPAPGGTLIATVNKHYAPITHTITVPPYCITLSVNTIDVVKFMQTKMMKSLFQVALPSIAELLNVIDEEEDDCYKGFKPVLVGQISDLSSEDREAPESFPLSFLLVSKSIVFIIAPNREIKFRYKVTAKNSEILDAFFLNRNQLIVIESNATTIKLFPDLTLTPEVFTEYSVTDGVKVTQVCSKVGLRKNNIEALLTEIMFYLILADYTVKKVTVRTEGFVTSTISTLAEGVEDIFSSESPTPVEGGAFDVINSFKIRVESNILPTLREDVTMLKRDYWYDAIKHPYRSQDDNDFYFSTKTGSFIAAQENPCKKCTKLMIFKSATKEPVKSVHTFYEWKNEFFILQTENYMYVVHKNKHSKQQQHGDEYCFVEFSGRFDSFAPWKNSNCIIVSQNGLIEVYKIKCLENTHKIKNVLTFNAHSDTITSIINTSVLLTASEDGSIKMWDFLNRQLLDNDFTNYERTDKPISKLTVGQSYAATISNFDEIAIWKINTGSLVAKMEMGVKVKQMRFSRNEDYILILLETNELVAYSKSLVHKCKFIIEKNSSLHLIDHLSANVATFYAIDLKMFKLYELTFTPELKIPNIKQYSLNERVATGSLEDHLVVVNQNFEILFINKYLQRFRMFQLDGKDEEGREDGINYESKDEAKLLKEYFEANKESRFKYNLLNSTNDSIILLVTTVPGGGETKKRVKSGVVIRARLERKKKEKVKLHIEDVYFDCKNVSTQPEALCVHTIQQSTAKVLINRIFVQNIKNSSHYELTIEQQAKINLIAIDPNVEYLAFNDSSKIVSLYRLSDGKKLASVPLYDRGIEMKFSLDCRFLCISMQDRRVFSLLVVDENNSQHVKRIGELPSRQKEQQNYRRQSLVHIIDEITPRKQSFDKKTIHEAMIDRETDTAFADNSLLDFKNSELASKNSKELPKVVKIPIVKTFVHGNDDNQLDTVEEKKTDKRVATAADYPVLLNQFMGKMGRQRSEACSIS